MSMVEAGARIESGQAVDSPCLWIVIPCYNEGAGGGALTSTASEFLQALDSLVNNGIVASTSKICYVDDGSTDDTWELIASYALANAKVVGVRLSRNRGHQNALLAGLFEARGKCDIAVTMDCDGQDDIGILPRMIELYAEGNHVVYGVRSDRESDSLLKRKTAEWFYHLLSASGVDVVFNHADYRLVDSTVLEALSEFDEVNLYLRGIFPLIGFSSAIVAYSRASRAAGTSKYSLGKMFKLAVDGITSFSVLPIRLISLLGIALCGLSLVGITWVVVSAVCGLTVSGWSSLMCAIGLIGGLQFLCLGVIGEYLGRTYLEAKKRPRFFVSDKVGV